MGSEKHIFNNNTWGLLVCGMDETIGWPINAVVYQIYPRSFQDSNGDGIGDLKGIIDHLDYLNDGTEKSLGINTIWLSPIYPSPMADFGYDVSDYRGIDPIFGTLDDFKTLLSECHKRGIKLLMDFIPNHTSSEHEWFKESQESKSSLKRDFYIWKDPKKDGVPPNNWLSCFGGSAWEFDSKSQQYYLHSFHKKQPDLNWRNPLVVKEMLDVLRFWLEMGVDGFRVDVPEWILKDEKFLDEPDNSFYASGSSMDPYQKLSHIYTIAQEGYIDILKKFVHVLEQYGDKFLVTEMWSPSEQLIKVYTQMEKRSFAPFSYFAITHPWKAIIHRASIDSYDDGVTQLYTPTYVLGNHDKPRFASRVRSSQARVAALLLFTLRGIPFIYYGEEIGMEDTNIPIDRVQDPFEKNVPGLGLGRDPQRTPMQWDSAPFSDFSTSEPWLPVNKNYQEINVQVQNSDPCSLLSLYKTLIGIRRHSKALLLGQYSSWDCGSEEVFTYTRHKGSDVVLVVLNYSDTDQKIVLPFRRGSLLLDSHFKLSSGTEMNLHDLLVPANAGYLIKI